MDGEKKIESMSGISNTSMCKRARSFEYKTVTNEHPENYSRTAIIRSTIASALAYKVRDPKEVMEYMKARYEECGYMNYQQKKINLLWDHRLVMRYLNDEKRVPVFPKSEVIELGNRLFRVSPDVAFVSGTDNDTVELVQIRIGKPDVTSKGTKNALIRDLRLYAMIQYGRNAGFKKITASLYFLKKSNDTSNWLQCEQNFFGGGGNIVSLNDIYTGEQNNLDDEMESKIQLLEDGLEPESVCKEDCEHCDKYDLCKYLMPPMSIVKDPIVRSASDIRLTANQEKAVEYDHGIVRINAGAGAGKTMVVALRIKRLIEKGVKPEEICCVTFTNAGAKEMLHRAELYAGCDLSGMKICTFNSFQNDIVMDCWEDLGFAREPKVIDDIEKYAIIAKLLNQNPIYEWTGRSFLNFSSTGGFGTKGALRIAADVFSLIKKMQRPVSDISTSDIRDQMSFKMIDINDSALDKLIKLYDLYDTELKSHGLIEFEDQEILTFKVLESDPTYLENHYPFRHIIVDEFQDTSEGQINFVKQLRALPTFESLMVVGDDSQSIFGFRDTSPEYIIHFEDYMGEHVDDIFLLENHRSTPEIIDFANRINAMNVNRVEKDLVATRPHGAPVIVNGFYDKTSEMKYILNGIKSHLDAGWRPEDIAVIAYTKDELKAIADILTKENIPSMFAAPEPLLENSRIRAILAFAKVIQDRADTKNAVIVANALNGGDIMLCTEDTIQAQVASVVQRAEAINSIPTLAGKKLLFLQLVDDLYFGDETVQSFKEGLNNKAFDEIMVYCHDFALYGANASYRRIDEYPGIVLITAHSSKGLEYKVVYNTISRYQKTGFSKRTEMEEVRRLLFVSATRARDELFITGQYSASGNTADTRVLNAFLQDAFTAVDKNYDPHFLK